MKKKVLILNSQLCGGGAERIAQLGAGLLAGPETELTIWAPQGSKAQLARCYPPGTRFYRLPFWDGPCRRFSPLWFRNRFCRLLFEGLLLRLRRWDMIVAMKEGPSMRLASRLRAKKRLAWVHTDYSSLHWSKWSFHSDREELACMARFDRVCCVSEAVRESLIRSLGDPGNLQVLYNPVDAAGIRKRAEEPIPEKDLPSAGPVLIAVGRLDPVKRFSLLIDVCRELGKRYSFSLWIVGGGEEEEALMRQCADLPFIRLLGQKDNPYPYIARADWLISASESESYGLTVQEALILGVPVLACACPGIRESLEPRFGKPVGMDREALLEGLREILEHPEQTGAYGRRIQTEFDAQALWAPRLAAIRGLFEEQ